MALNSDTQLLTINNWRLPPEIMSEIFILCTTVKTRSLDDFDFEQDISTSSLLSLIYVCRLWRSIANSTQALWTSLRIYIPLDHRTNQGIQDIQQWISRSGQLPLSIQVHHNRSLPIIFPHPDEGDDLINLVNSYSHRWESLKITLTPRMLPLFRDSSSGPSILKTLILAPGLILDLRQHPFNIGASLPSPSYVSLSSPHVWPLGICWDKVTRFTARRMGSSLALEILRLPPQLQEFILFELEEEFDDDLPSSPVLHSRLETLHVYLSLEAISFQYMDISYQLMDRITSPSLKHFNYSGRHPPIDSIVDFLDRSRCPLKTFSLRDADIGSNDIIYLLRGMPHLESLTLGTRNITDGLLKLLATTAVLSPYQIDDIFLPNLQSLKCIGRPIFSWSWLPIVFGSRANDESGASDSAASESGTFASDTSEAGTSEPGAFDRRPLRSFTVVQDVDDADHPEASVVEELEHLREEGYVIDIVFGRVESVLTRA
jgi:hypothetical protein